MVTQVSRQIKEQNIQRHHYPHTCLLSMSQTVAFDPSYKQNDEYQDFLSRLMKSVMCITLCVFNPYRFWVQTTQMWPSS